MATYDTEIRVGTKVDVNELQQAGEKAGISVCKG